MRVAYLELPTTTASTQLFADNYRQTTVQEYLTRNHSLPKAV